MKRYFVRNASQPRVRRASDALLVVVGLVLVVWTALRPEPISDLERALFDLLRGFPVWFEQVYEIVYFLGALMVVALLVAVVAHGKQRLDLLRDMVLAVVASSALSVLLVALVGEGTPQLWPELSSLEPEPAFPIVRVAVVTAVLLVAAPHLVRPIRRLGWVIVALVTISGFGLGFGWPSDAVGAVGVGLVAGGVVLLGFGSPRGYPDIAQIRAALAELGLEVTDVELTPDQSWGVRRLAGMTGGTGAVEIKAYGRDAADSQLLAKLWRNLWYRDEAQQFTLSRLQGVEHEALALMMADRAGCRVPVVLAVGLAGDDVALLATTREGERRPTEVLSEPDLSAMWGQLQALHGAAMSHGHSTIDVFSFDEGGVVLNDFDSASFSASNARLAIDRVALLISSAAVIDVAAAVRAARTTVGEESLEETLPYLQVPALSRAQRKAIEKPKTLIKALRDAVAEQTGAELPEPAKLRRIRWQDLVMPALSLIAAYALITMLSDIDFAAVWDVVRDAAWVWIVVGFIVGQFVFLPEATGMLFATGHPLPLRPLTILQVSVKWIGLAVPSAAGRVTMNTLFLRKYGVPPTIALTQGAIDGISGFVVEALILVIAFAASDLSLDLNTGELNWGLILLIVVLIVVGTVVAFFRVKRLREVALPVLKDAWGLLAGVLKDPKRGLGLLGSNLASRIVLAMTLWFVLQAIGTPLPFVVCLIVTVATNLLAGLVPIPGGIGVAEAVLTSFLVLAGLESEVAFAVAVVFRFATFYIPAGEGFFAMKWLQDGGYL